MARHYKLPGLMTPAEKMARVAADAQTVARRALTRRSGTIVVQNDDGSKTVIGPGAGTDATGSPTGVAEWVGDTTPPGKPTGVSATSSWGTVYLRWDGTLEGGVPADFAYVSVAVGGTEAGRMPEAGVLALDGYEDGTVLDVAFTAWDAARDADGAPAPNASETATVSVTVSDARAEIDAEVDAIRGEAEAAGERADELASALEGVSQKVDDVEAGAVTATYEEYAVSPSRAEPPSGGWSREPPPATADGVVWRRTATQTGDGMVTRSEPVPLTGEPGTTMAIECDGGTVLRNGGGSTVMRAVVHSGASECRTAAELIALFGAGAAVEWDELGADGWEPVAPGDPRLSEGGMALEADAGEIEGQATYRCRLVAGEENGVIAYGD